MKLSQFLEHHGLAENPFAHEEATDDDVFRRHLIAGTHHPAWDKIFGSAESPSTSIVFGEQGAGKTALRMQMVDQIRQHNNAHTDQRIFVVEYEDLNPFLDTLREKSGRAGKTPEKALRAVRLTDHMDAILSLATTKLLDMIAGSTEPAAAALDETRLRNLTRLQKRDLLLLAGVYDRSIAQARPTRWSQVRRRVGFSNWKSLWDSALGVCVMLSAFTIVLGFGALRADGRAWGFAILASLIGWSPFLFHRLRLWWISGQVAKQVRVLERRRADLRTIFSKVPRNELLGQPLPRSSASDPRYELFHKLSSVLRGLGYSSMLVFVDRVDEPHLVNGQPERIRDLLWPMLDHKFLGTSDIAFKMLLPAGVTRYLNRQDEEFYQRSRLDKRNLVQSLEWSGESLYDIVNDRLRVCAATGKPAVVAEDLFADGIDRSELIAKYARLRLPRHLFKFHYRLFVDHCSKYTDMEPSFAVSRETLESTLAVFMRDLDAYDRGQGAG